MSVEKNVELKVEISSFSGLKLRQASPSTNSTWRRRNNGKFCYMTFDEYSKFSRTTLVLTKERVIFCLRRRFLKIGEFNFDVHALFIRTSKFDRVSLFSSFCTI